MKEIIVASCPRNGNIQLVALTQPIHERKATGTSTLRKQINEMVATILLNGKVLKSKVLRHHNSKVRRTIRFAVSREFMTDTGQRFLRILIWAKLLVCDAAGELVERWHNFRINHPLPSEQPA